MSIDWSVAPEGFDYYLIGRSLAAPGKAYMKIDSVQRYVSASGSFVAFEDAGEFEIHRRPAWSGEGLPPVGTVCEVDGSAGSTGFAPCVILYSSQDVTVWKYAASDLGQPSEVEHWAAYGEREFRMIRTPEQIAAERKGREITDMLNIVNGPSLKGKGVTQQLEALYDAGFQRKVAE